MTNRANIDSGELDKRGYLNILKQHVSGNKLIFDIDCSWNINSNDSSLDEEYISRVREIWDNTKEQQMILCDKLILHSNELKKQLKLVVERR